MQLVIAEKPSVARDLARVLGLRAAAAGGRNAIEGPDRVITWCIGHLVELEEPAAYDSRWKSWRMDTLPMIPTAFKLRPVAGTRAQLQAVSAQLRDRRFSEVVNGCDAGREGELIFRYVYDLAGSRLPVRRLWISSLTDEAIRQGFASLRPGATYDALADAARCRSEADWLVGMNATRAVTIQFRISANQSPAAHQGVRPGPPRGRAPLPAVYSIGRVQTPTLAILVRREQVIRAFQPRDYWEVRGAFDLGGSSGGGGGGGEERGAGGDGNTFTALWTWRPDGKAAISGAAGDKVAAQAPIARFGVRAVADQVVARATSCSADAGGGHVMGDGAPVVERLVQKQTREPPPALFDLTALQRTANRRYGLSATRTLAAAQALYERHKLLTYPRTDSRHLPQDLAPELPKLVGGLAKLPAYAAFAEPLLLGDALARATRSRRIFDGAKVHDHHAIIPTGKVTGATTLDGDDHRIFDLVARRFLGVFHPDAEFALTEAVIRVGAPAPVVGNENLGTEGADEPFITALPPPPDRFIARGRVRLVVGWQAVAGFDEPRGTGPARDHRRDRGDGGQADKGAPDVVADFAAVTLPKLHEGQRLLGRFESLTRQTRPPPRHTEATLLGAMESAGREIEDETLRAAMKDTGLGTPATRAATIETLVKRGFIVREGKQVVATATGIALIERLPVPTLASPELTGAWEARLVRIARGQESRADFMGDIVRYIRQVTDAVRDGGRTLGTTGRAPPAPAPSHAAAARPFERPAPRRQRRADTSGRAPKPPRAPPILACPRCRQGSLLAGNRGWGCSRWREGCPFVIWFAIDGRRITEAQLRDLVEKGKTRRAKWGRAGTAPVGRLVLDLAAAREQGAARFLAE